MEFSQNTITLNVEINESIYRCMQDFLDTYSDWNQKSVINASMSLFLLQNHRQIKPLDYQACSRSYVQFVCDRESKFSQN